MTTQTYGRAKVSWPDLGSPGGAPLHAELTTGIAFMGNNMSRRWSGSQVVAAAGVFTFTHDLGLALADTRIRIYESGSEISAAQIASGFTIAFVDNLSFTVTNTGGSTRTIEVYAEPVLKIKQTDIDPGFLVVTATGTQSLTNKDFNGGTASNTSRLTIPKAPYATLLGLTRKQGTITYASDQNVLYSDDGTSLSPIGGNWTTVAAQTLGVAGTIAISLTTGLQIIPVSGTSAAVTTATQAFGASAPSDGTEIQLLGMSNTNTVTINHADSAKGPVLNGNVTLLKGSTLNLFYSLALDRWVEKSRNIISIA